MAEPLPSAVECARLYLSPPLPSFWRWADDQQAIEWLADTRAGAGGGTILLREELDYLLRHRADAGLGMPPLQAIVLLAATLRDPGRIAALGDLGDIPDLVDIWRRLRNNPEARATFYDQVLFTAPCNTHAFASRVADALAVDLPSDLFRPRAFRPVWLDTVMKWIRRGLRGLSVERIEQIARTGVDRLPHAEGVELALRDAAVGVLRELEHDTRLVGFAGVVRQAMAAFRVPRLAQSPEQQAEGGVSGLTNRGSLDRLALSELAHDDHVLAVRIATNEALYIEREVPPHTPRFRRRILLDCGVSMWGVPRVLAVAVAMALCANAETQAELSVSVARHGLCQPVDLGRHEGVVSQLEELDGDLDLRRALPAFLAPAEETAGDEPVVIVHRDTALDPEFRACLAAGVVGRRFVVDIDDAGGARLWMIRSRGWQLLGEVALSTARLVVRSFEHAPAYYSLDPPPLPPRRRADPPDLVAIAWVYDRLGVRTRRGRAFTVRMTARGNASLLLDEDADGLDEVPLLPGPRWHDPPLTVAELGRSHLVFCDRRLLHFVPREADGGELSVHVTLQNELIGYCSHAAETLRGRPLYERMLAIAAEAS